MEKSSEVYRRNNNGPKTLSRYSWHDVNQFNLTTVHHNVLWSIWLELCQYRQHRTSNTHRTELLQNSLMIDPIKGCAKINLCDSSLLYTLQRTMKCMRHTQKSISGTQTFPISKLGGWISTPLRFMNHPRRTYTRRSNTLNNTSVMEIGL